MHKQVEKSLNDIKTTWYLIDDEAKTLACKIFVSDLKKYNPDTYHRLVEILKD